MTAQMEARTFHIWRELSDRGGLFAISLRLSANFPNDHEMLGHGMVMYDALYTWCRKLQAEMHNWPSASLKQARHD
jgi:hypothetical protein